MLQDVFPSVRLSRRTIRASLHRIQFTRKRIKRKIQPFQHPNQDSVLSLLEFYRSGRRIFCVDESGFADRQARITGYSRKGEECVLPPAKQHFQCLKAKKVLP